MLTLTVGGAHYVADYSHVTWSLAAGTPVYAQVDSANAETTYGAVLEAHEIVDDPYNNIAGPALPTSAEDGERSPAIEPDSQLGRTADLPKRTEQ